MVSTQSSRCAIFRRIAQTSYYQWPTYTDTQLYDRSSTGGLAEDARVLASVWFEHDAHNSIGEFVCHWPLAYVEFDTHDRYTGRTEYNMDQLFRAFLLKEIYGWEHETALLTHLEQRPLFRRHLGFEILPDQSTLWRSWHERFTAELRSTIETVTRTILIKAQKAGVAVPRKPEPHLPSHDNDADEPDPDDQAVLNEAATITEYVSRVVFPGFSLDRGVGCEIHENAYGTYRRIWVCGRTSPQMRVLAASSTSRLESGHHWVTPIASIFVISRSNRFERCTGKPSTGS